MVWQFKYLITRCEIVHVWVVCIMISFLWDTCCGCLVALSWGILLCILSSSYASPLWIGKIPWARCFWGSVSLLPVLTTLILRNVCVCNPGPRSKQKFPVLFNFMTSSMKRSVELRLQFLTGLIYLKVWSVIRIGPYQCFEKTSCCD